MLKGIEKNVSSKSYTYLKYDKSLKYLSKPMISINNLLDIDKKTNLLINSYLAKPMKYIDIKNMKINGKWRMIVSYKGNSFGNELRKFHENLAFNLLNFFKFSENVFGYIKGKSIQQCLNRHKDDIYFMKIDIKNFFNSINKVKLNKIFRILMTSSNIDEAKERFNGKISRRNLLIHDLNKYRNILSACCYKNKIPLGFSSSPVISNIYLLLFDYILEYELKGLHYSRYADDILISSACEMNYEKIKELINEKLSDFDLQLNEKKVHYYKLEKRGDHAKFLGINIVKCEFENKLTIGHKYLMETSKMLSFCLENNEKLKDKVLGRIEYIKLSSEYSYEKLLKIIEVKLNLEFDLEKFKRNEMFSNISKQKEFANN